MGVTKLFDKILRAGEGKKVRQLADIANQINQLEPLYVDMTDEELSAQTILLKKRYWGDNYQKYLGFINGDIAFDGDGDEIKGNGELNVLSDETPLKPLNGEKLDNLLPEAFAIIREASKRILGQRHFDVQLMGGASLFKGNISEMKTGEGKTLVATLPAYLASITGLGVHVVTVNDYLASYQSELMGRIFRFLNVSVGCILSNMTPDQRRIAYAKDITYGTNNEFGFDYLRDNMAMQRSQLVQRGYYFAIVDEVDSILIDEARTPLIISGHAAGDLNEEYIKFAKFVKLINRDEDYEVDEKKKTVGVLDSAIDKIESHLGIDNLYDAKHTYYVQFLQNAIRAKELFHRDKDYIVRSGEVLIVDEHTGRVLSARRYSEGMHQALEAKEGVKIQEENQTYATITLQNYFRMYKKLSGMTGTAETEAAEFMGTYSLGVVPIPTNMPMLRTDQTDYIFRTENGKYKAIISDVKDRFAVGQPVLLGTGSVEKSEVISAELKKAGIPHNVLNAKHHEHEAAIIAMAGRKGSITVATNMAGRGTDIMLGGNSEFLARENMKKKGFDAEEDLTEYNKNWPEAIKEARAEVQAEHDEVVELGGLYVIGTERHESRRIDNQLRGRSGRQGDPGESRFYISMEDDLMRLFNTAMMQQVMQMGVEEDQPIEVKMVAKSIESAQRQVEARNFEIRKDVLKYDEVMSRQREVVYNERKKVLLGVNIAPQIQNFIEDTLNAQIRENAIEEYPKKEITYEEEKEVTIEISKEEGLNRLISSLNTYYNVSFTSDELIEQSGNIDLLNSDNIYNEVLSDAQLQYASRSDLIGANNMRQLERNVTLVELDRCWRQHLASMDYLREGIGLRAMAQKDPLIEYTSESAYAFNQMNYEIRAGVIRTLLKMTIELRDSEDDKVEELGIEDDNAVIDAVIGPNEDGLQVNEVDNPEEYAHLSRADRRKAQKKQKKSSKKDKN